MYGRLFIQHLGFIFHLLCLFSGFLTAGLGFLLFLKYRLAAIFYYALFVLSTTLTVLSTSVGAYLGNLENFSAGFWFSAVSQGLFLLFLIAINTAFNLFSANLTNEPRKMGESLLVTLPALWFILAGIAFFAVNLKNNTWTEVPAVNLFSAMILAQLFFSFIYRGIQIFRFARTTDNFDLKRALKALAWIILIFIPLQTLVIATKQDFWLIMAGRNLFYLTLNITALGFAVKYFFLNPPTIMEKVQIPDSFVEKFAISPREREVIDLLLSGLSIKEIAARLYRSFKTVNNHIYNIYRKCQIGSKLELLNLIREMQL